MADLDDEFGGYAGGRNHDAEDRLKVLSVGSHDRLGELHIGHEGRSIAQSVVSARLLKLGAANLAVRTNVGKGVGLD